MSYAPMSIDDGDPLMVGTLTKNGLAWLYEGQRVTVPASGTLVANQVYYVPFYLNRGYTIARWWWQNGATVGTNNFQCGIYTEALSLFASLGSTLSAGTANQVRYTTPGSPIYVPPMRGYLAFWCNGTTATVFRTTGASATQSNVFIQTGQTTGLPSTAVPASSTGALGHVVNHGFTRNSSP